MPLTDTAIRNAKPGITPTGKVTDSPYKMGDAGGLYLEVAPTGGKWWRLKYRYDGKEKRLSLGVYPDVSLKDARQRCDDACKLLADGVDPGENRKAVKATKTERAANSFEVIAREWFARKLPGWAGGGRYVFPGARTNGSPMSDNAILAALRRMGFARDEMASGRWRAPSLMKCWGYARTSSNTSLHTLCAIRTGAHITALSTLPNGGR